MLLTNFKEIFFYILLQFQWLDMSFNSDTLTRFRIFALTLNAVCVLSGEATHTNFIVVDLTRTGLFIK